MSATFTSSHSPEPPDAGRDRKFLKFCRELPLFMRVAVIKVAQPGWTVGQIADVLGVDERTVLRSPSYRRLREIDKARPSAQSKWRGRRRRRIDERGFSNPADPFA